MFEIFSKLTGNASYFENHKKKNYTSCTINLNIFPLCILKKIFYNIRYAYINKNMSQDVHFSEQVQVKMSSCKTITLKCQLKKDKSNMYTCPKFAIQHKNVIRTSLYFLT